MIRTRMADPFATLAQGIRNSNRQAFTELYDELHEDLHLYAWHLTSDAELMYDIVQDAFIILWDKRQSLDSSRNLRGLLFRIVRNLAYKHHRHKKINEPIKRSIDVFIANDGPQRYDEHVLRVHLSRILAGLSERQREVFEMSRMGYLKHREIAEILNISPKTVRNHLSSALQLIREQFDRLGIER